jgi:hypothetical protein
MLLEKEGDYDLPQKYLKDSLFRHIATEHTITGRQVVHGEVAVNTGVPVRIRHANADILVSGKKCGAQGAPGSLYSNRRAVTDRIYSGCE